MTNPTITKADVEFFLGMFPPLTSRPREPEFTGGISADGKSTWSCYTPRLMPMWRSPRLYRHRKPNGYRRWGAHARSKMTPTWKCGDAYWMPTLRALTTKAKRP